VYLLPIIWALYGIHAKHLGAFQGQFPLVILSLKTTIVAFTIAIVVKNRYKVFSRNY
jgi:hypothetical protein